uniref:Cytochrome b561 domain-containing protein n=1 Tax=Panagrolaimus sp. ES5 TaxID=591445 RepID=A0AC34FZ93_9BILA
GDDTAIACVIIGGVGKVYAAWNDKTRGYLQRDATPKMISNSSATFVNGDMRCTGLWSFKPTSALKEPSHILDLSNPNYNFHFLFVRGFADPNSGELAGHDITDSSAFPWISSIPIQFCQSASTCNGSSITSQLITLNQSHQSGIPRLIKHTIALLHAIFMMTAWFCIAGKCTLHRILMILVFILVTAAFFGILYQAEWKIFMCSFQCDHEAFSKQVHTIAGICVYILLCFQVLCGICRPGKTSSIRHIFNWIHTVSGFTAWIAAATCCVLGIELGKTGFHYYPNGGKWPEIIMLVIIVSFIICAIICEISSRRNKYMPEVDDKVRNMEESKDGFNCCTLFFVLAYICISISGVTNEIVRILRQLN